MASKGPSPSSELKLSAAARVATRDSPRTVIVIETTRMTANARPLGERSFRNADCQISRW